MRTLGFQDFDCAFSEAFANCIAFGRLGWFWSGSEWLCIRSGMDTRTSKDLDIREVRDKFMCVVCTYVLRSIHMLKIRLTPCSLGLYSVFCAVSEASSRQNQDLPRYESRQGARLLLEGVGACP